jgi:hypothetical protein
MASKVLFSQNGVEFPMLGEVVSFDGFTEVNRDVAIAVAKQEGLDSSIFRNISKKSAFIHALREHKTKNLVTYVDTNNQTGLITFQFDKKLIEAQGSEMVARFERVTSIMYDMNSDCVLCDDDEIRNFVYQQMKIAQETYTPSKMFTYTKELVEQECGDRLLRMRKAGAVYIVRAAATEKLHRIVAFLNTVCPTIEINIVPLPDVSVQRERMMKVVEFETGEDLDDLRNNLEKKMEKLNLDADSLSMDSIQTILDGADNIVKRLDLYTESLETKFESSKTLIESFKLTARETLEKKLKEVGQDPLTLAMENFSIEELAKIIKEFQESIKK